MNYYLDTEFIEDFTNSCLVIPDFKREKPRHYIDLISIGIVAEDGRDYYAVSNEFDLKHVWNKYDLKSQLEMGDPPVKVYWLRENVLKPLWLHLRKQITGAQKEYTSCWETFTYSHLKQLIAQFGKSNKQIAKEIEDFTSQVKFRGLLKENPDPIDTPVFYGYYADYDWVLFCSLFDRMLDLPKGYPMYCRDLKQMMDELSLTKQWKDDNVPGDNEHHALADARWNHKLHRMLKTYMAGLPQLINS
jgi:hypothetical protein